MLEYFLEKQINDINAMSVITYEENTHHNIWINHMIWFLYKLHLTYMFSKLYFLIVLLFQGTSYDEYIFQKAIAIVAETLYLCDFYIGKPDNHLLTEFEKQDLYQVLATLLIENYGQEVIFNYYLEKS